VGKANDREAETYITSKGKGEGTRMSKEVAGGYKSNRVLRRSKRQRKVVTPVGNSSETDSIDSEAEIIAGWSSKENAESPDDVVSLGGFTDLAEAGFVVEKTTAERWEAMSRKEPEDRGERVKESRD